MALVIDIEGDSENIVEAIQQENSSAINRVRSLFIDPGFPDLQDGDAETAVPTEELPKDKL